MITARFMKHDKGYSGLEVSGHAFFDEPGKDIVCAGVSALATTGYNALCHYLGEDKLQITVRESDGYLHFRIGPVSEKEQEQVDVIMTTIRIGIESISEAYASHVRIEEGGGRRVKN